MKFTISWEGPIVPYREFRIFVQSMAHRIIQGHYRYGFPKRRKKYLTRLTLELKAYKETGNVEHLFNLSNYAYLEMVAPQHPRQNFDNLIDSVTRGKGYE